MILQRAVTLSLRLAKCHSVLRGFAGPFWSGKSALNQMGSFWLLFFAKSDGKEFSLYARYELPNPVSLFIAEKDNGENSLDTFGTSLQSPRNGLIFAAFSRS